MAKLNFQKTLLQFSVSHDPSEIILKCWYSAQETFLFIIHVLFIIREKKEFLLLNI